MAYYPGQTLGRGDINIFLVDNNNQPTNAAEITYALYWVDPVFPNPEVLIGDPNRIPVNPSVGEYYAALMIPPSATLGTYRVRWTFKQLVSSPAQQVVIEFTVEAQGAINPLTYSGARLEMITKLRMLLRDQNPDKFYHFRPPEFEGNIGRYDRVFGQIWQDDELLEYCERALDWFNMFPPFTGKNVPNLDRLVKDMPAWRTAILWGAISHACFALAINWVADEFDYSIGGVSLTLEKSSKYESLKSNSEAQFDKATEAKARTVKFIRGLQQPRFGIGIRSAFGPFTGKGVLSPRSFLVLPWVLFCGTLLVEVLQHAHSMPPLLS